MRRSSSALIGYGWHMTGTRQPRRSPRPGERQRDPERTRARILAAAKVEFGAKGFAGARVSDIAERAGVNKQLISYYFDGKEGLYAELTSQWQRTSNELAGEDRPLDAVVEFFATSSLHDPDGARLMVRSNLAAVPDDPTAAQEAEFLRAQVADLRRRQVAGELSPDLDPACVLLAMFAAASATITLPRVTAAVRADHLSDEEFTRYYAGQLGKLVRHLADGPRPKITDETGDPSG
ncbi:MAG: TetR family transcriptional regulator [Pseudonocardiaceae bacterium]|nr:TetR family transcriptional regulator [Pseudonocardiaceae bacterium]